MTLIAAFRSSVPRPKDDNDYGFVICADSQETVKDRHGNEYRVTKQKILPIECGHFELAIGGSGNHGDCIDSCTRYLQRRVRKSSVNNLEELEELLAEELLVFLRKDGSLFSKSERLMNLVIVARALDNAGVEAWHTKGAQLFKVERHVLVGWNEQIYEHFAQRLYPDGPCLPLQQCALLGMYLMALAENTSNYVRSPVRVVVARRYGIFVLPASKVKKYEERMTIFGAQLDNLMLLCSDQTIRRDEYIAKLEEFKATALHLRDEYVRDAVQTLPEMFNINDPMPDVPRGTLITLRGDRSIVVNEDPVEVEKFRRMVELIKIEAGEGPILLKVRCKCGNVFEAKLASIRVLDSTDLTCNTCNEVTRLTEVERDDVSLCR